MSRTKRSGRTLPVVRAIGVLSAVGIITSLVTFAAIQSTGNALTGNTIETATATLQIGRDSSSFGDSVAGYSFSGIVPGGSAQPAVGYGVSLKNTGTTNLALSLSIPTAPVMTGISDLSKVTLKLTPLSGSGGTYTVQPIRLSDLIAGKVALTRPVLPSGSIASFQLQVSMDADAVNGGGATISGLDLSFSGVPQ